MRPTRHGPSRLSRRALLSGSLAAATLGLAGCGSADSALDDRVRVRQWNLFGGGDGTRMIEMHDLYRAEHAAAVDLQATTFAWGPPFYTKLAMGAAGGRAAEIATVHTSRLKSLAPGRLLDPIDLGELAEAGLSQDRFPPNIWDKCVVDGRLYAIPIDTHALVNHYNREICGRAGVLDGDGRLVETHGVQEYFDLLAAVKDVTGTYGMSLDTNAGWRQFWAWYRQQDGEMAFGEGDFTMDDDKALVAMDVMYRLAEQGLVPRTSDGAATSANFVNGLAGLVMVGNWEIVIYTESGMDFSIAEIPDFFGSRRTQGDCHAYVLPHQRDPDPAVRAATLAYASWMLRHSLTWAGGGHTPAYLPIAQSPEYAALQPQSEYRAVAENVQFDPVAWFSGSAARLQDDANATFQALYAGTLTPEAALAQFKGIARTLLDIPSPV